MPGIIPLEARLFNESGEVVDSSPIVFDGERYSLAEPLDFTSPNTLAQIHVYGGQDVFMFKVDFGPGALAEPVFMGFSFGMPDA